ncbi:MAG: hypothetical protein JNJ88_03655 [Planctomycetes bacterium]|nr:hypothetical protein [Planctomycetota bacterium]
MTWDLSALDQLRSQLRDDCSIWISVTWNGQHFSAISTAAGEARASIIGKTTEGELPATNGWDFWKYLAADGTWVEIDRARQAFLESQKEGPAERLRARPR